MSLRVALVKIEDTFLIPKLDSYHIAVPFGLLLQFI